MSMDMNCEGIKPPDDKWLKMKKAWDACKEAGIPAPDMIVRFFDHEPPDAVGVVVNLLERPCLKTYCTGGRSGYEVDLKKLPPDVTIIRFYNSW